MAKKFIVVSVLCMLGLTGISSCTQVKDFTNAEQKPTIIVQSPKPNPTPEIKKIKLETGTLLITNKDLLDTCIALNDFDAFANCLQNLINTYQITKASEPLQATIVQEYPKYLKVVLEDGREIYVSKNDIYSNNETSSYAYIGTVITGDTILVDTTSINNNHFKYKIGDEVVSAEIDCKNNEWNAYGYGWYSPQTPTTQKMLDYVCKEISMRQE